MRFRMKRVKKKLDNFNLINKITLTCRLQICTIYVRVTALRATQNALTGLMRPANHSLPTSVPEHQN